MCLKGLVTAAFGSSEPFCMEKWACYVGAITTLRVYRLSNTGSFGHADNLWGVVPSLTCAARIVEAFTVENSLKPNLDKLEILPMYEGCNISPESEQLQVSYLSITSSKCLSVMWSSNLSPKASIDLNINKAHKAFFALGSMGIHQGMLNPLTCTVPCIVSVCLYGSENWILTEQLLGNLRLI